MADLCTIADVEERLGRLLSDEESGRAPSAIADVSWFLRAECPGIPDGPPYPDPVVGVAARMAQQLVLTDPQSAQVVSEGIGNYQVTRRDTSELRLTAAWRRALRPWMRSRVSSVALAPGPMVGGR